LRSLNLIDGLGLQSKQQWYLWSHSDALLIARDTRLAHESMLDVIRTQSTGNVAIIFFGYDFLNAVNTNASQAAPWDTNLMQYGSDCGNIIAVNSCKLL